MWAEFWQQYGLSVVEWTAVLFSVACVWLSARRDPRSWPVGILGIVGYMALFYHYRLYADLGLQFVYLGQSIYGWWFWRRNPVLNERKRSDIRRLSPKGYAIWGTAGLVCWGAVAWLLDTYTDSDMPYLDALASTLSLVANTLLARKVLENWILWILADVLLVYIFIQKGLLISAVTYFGFLCLAVAAFAQWRRGKRF